jgi:3-oxoacyl-[acyl-carrier protein] reductase
MRTVCFFCDASAGFGGSAPAPGAGDVGGIFSAIKLRCRDARSGPQGCQPVNTAPLPVVDIFGGKNPGVDIHPFERLKCFQPMALLLNQIAVVTGAGRGIGRAIALRFAREGADVVCISRTAENAAKVAAEVQELGRKSWSLAVDVADATAVASAAKEIVTHCGRVDVLVNNAGVTRDGLLMRMSEEDWDTVLNTNLRGAFVFTKALSRAFLKQRSGRIINLASVVGLVGNAGQANYAASKAGLIGLTKSVAKEFASRGVTCNAIAPGFIRTDMTGALDENQKAQILAQIPLGSLGEPEDIAEAAVFLAGPGGRYVTGQVLTVDGGMVM